MGEFSYTEREGHVLTVVLNRPERMNALHSPAHFELDQIFNDFEADPDLGLYPHRRGRPRSVPAMTLSFRPKAARGIGRKAAFGSITERFDRTKP